MTRFLSICMLFAAICYLNADQIVPAAFQKIFPYASAAKVKALTTNVNKQTTIANAKKAVTTWVPANWKAAGAKVDAKNPLSKQAYAQNKALTFIDFRFSERKYVNFLVKEGLASKMITKEQSVGMTKLYWAADIKAENNFNLTAKIVSEDAEKAAAARGGSMKELNAAMANWVAKFIKTFPKDYKNLQWTL